MQPLFIQSFDNLITAYIMMGRLQNDGVECKLFDENTLTLMPYLNNALGGIKLVVDKSDESRARQLLEKYQQEEWEGAECPQCGHKEFILLPQKKPSNYFTAIFTWLFTNYALSVNQYECQHCHYSCDTLPQKQIV